MPAASSPLSREFWCGRVDPRPLALFRIAIGVVVFSDLGDRLRDFYAFYTDRGIWPHGFVAWSWIPSLLSWSSRPTYVGAVFAFGAAAAVALIIGYRTRLATLSVWLFLCALQARCPLITDGGDTVMRAVLFWALFADLGAAFSLDVRMGRRPAVATVPAFPLRILQIQVALVYAFSAISKSGASWRDGSAIERALHLQSVSRPLGVRLARHPSICRLLTPLVLAFEVTFTPLVFSPWKNRIARAVALAGGVALHVGIYATMRVSGFSFVMMACYPLFLAPEWIDRASVRLRLASTTDNPTLRFPRWLAWALSAQLALVVGELGARRLGHLLPRPLSAELHLTGLAQAWGMFSPDPPSVDPRWSAPGLLSDGRKVDALDAAPLLVSRIRFRYSRWDKLQTSLAQADDDRLLDFGRYLCRRYNDGTRPGRLVRFELVLTRVPIAPATAEERYLLLTQPCDAKGSVSLTRPARSPL